MMTTAISEVFVYSNDLTQLSAQEYFIEFSCYKSSKICTYIKGWFLTKWPGTNIKSRTNSTIKKCKAQTPF